ncbi:MAG: LytTR family DNA-binding domain-containing protein [Cyclobacteriaceae bacterium]
MSLKSQIIFWSTICLLLTVLFGQKWSSYTEAFYFATLLLPVILVTAYFFNSYLVPRYLITKRHFRFALYTVYTIIGSLFLTGFVVVFAFIYLANYRVDRMNPIVWDVVLMGFILYFVVFAYSFFLLTRKNLSSSLQVTALHDALTRNRLVTMTIKSERKNHTITLSDVLYIESLADYVKLHLSGRSLVTKEKISHFERELPEHFVRIHRSFLINIHQVESFTKESVTIGGSELPISRTYKQAALEALHSGRARTNKSV